MEAVRVPSGVPESNECRLVIARSSCGWESRIHRSAGLLSDSCGVARVGQEFRSARSAELPSDATHRLRHPKAKPGVLRLSSLWNSLAALLMRRAEQPSSIGRTSSGKYVPFGSSSSALAAGAGLEFESLRLRSSGASSPMGVSGSVPSPSSSSASPQKVRHLYDGV